MALEMRTTCERCGAALGPAGEAFVCSWECTFCPACTAEMGAACPNCGGELLRRPRRIPSTGSANSIGPTGSAASSEPANAAESIASPDSSAAGSSAAALAVQGGTAVYHPRPVRSLGVWEEDGWRIKLYAMAASQREPSAALLEAAKACARRHLPRPAVTGTRYGVGYLGIHECDGADYGFLGWWERSNELYHHLLNTRPDDSAAFQDATVTGTAPVGCVWELAVLVHERAAWMRHAMQASGRDLDAYLADRLDGWA